MADGGHLGIRWSTPIVRTVAGQLQCTLHLSISTLSTMNPSKTERIDVRASAQVKLLLQEAARASHKNVSEFLLDAGINAATQTLADRRRFVLDDARWQTFLEALDRPVQDKPRLQKLLNTPGLLG